MGFSVIVLKLCSAPPPPLPLLYRLQPPPKTSHLHNRYPHHHLLLRHAHPLFPVMQRRNPSQSRHHRRQTPHRALLSGGSRFPIPPSLTTLSILIRRPMKGQKVLVRTHRWKQIHLHFQPPIWRKHSTWRSSGSALDLMKTSSGHFICWRSRWFQIHAPQRTEETRWCSARPA